LIFTGGGRTDGSAGAFVDFDAVCEPPPAGAASSRPTERRIPEPTVPTPGRRGRRVRKVKGLRPPLRDTVDRDKLRPLVIALLAVLAVAVAAATVDTAVDTGGEFGLGDENGGGFSPPERNDSGGDRSNQSSEAINATYQAPCVTALQSPVVLLGAVAVVLLVVGAIAYREDLLSALGIAAAFLPFVGLGYLILTSCGPRQLSMTNPRPNVSSANDSGGGSLFPTGPAGEVPSLSALVLVGVVLLVLAVGAVILLGGEEETADPEEEEAEAESDADAEILAALGQAAGDAADRIDEAADVENEVFRAWREMTDHLDASRPAASTPGEFADAAVDAGMDPADVSTLTNLFREVRYGGAEPTPEREAAALDALRRIEREYADADADGDDGGLR
jgi:hypothetical protein